MTSGDSLLANQCWQDVPGTKKAKIFPFLKKIDTNSSNSYIISTPEAVVLIDPGGLHEQMDLLAGEIEKLTRTGPVPVIVFLTHAHVDHFLVIQSHPFFKSRNPVILAAHEKAAVLLSTGRTGYTQADMFGRTLDPITVALRFFGDRHGEVNGTGKIPGHDGDTLSLREADIQAGEDLTIRREVFGPDTGDRFDIFETPGHSPDGVCYRIGKLLFIGDLIFAANPGIAGTLGWNQKDLIESIGKVLWLLGNEDIGIICPGHGRVVPKAGAVAMLSQIRDDAKSLDGIAAVTPEWAQETARYAESLMDHVAASFTIMAGRCYRAAHILEELEESGEAEKISRVLDIHVIDEILDDFHRFSEDYRNGNQRDVHLALKAGQIASKLERVYEKERLDLVIDPYLVRRVARLLSDYMTTFRGFRQPADIEAFDPDRTLALFIGQFTEPDFDNEELMGLADSEEEYMLAFVRRIVRVPLFPDGRVVFEPSGQPCTALADPGRLNDLIASILEELAGADYTGATVHVGSGERNIIISVRAGKSGNQREIPEKDLGFMKKECEIAGGSLVTRSDAACFSVDITLPRSP